MKPSELAELRHQRAEAFEQMQRVLAETRDSGMNADQQRTYDDAERRFDALTDKIELAQAEDDAARHAPGVEDSLRRADGSRYRSTARRHDGPFLGERRMADALGIQADDDARDFSVGRFLQGLAGVRSLAEDSPEYRVVTGGGGSAGTLVPSAVASAILDGVFPASVVHQAGAQVVPMPARSLTLPRIDTPPVPAWHAEGVADVVNSEPGIGAAELQAKTVAVRFGVAIELLEDASKEAADGLRAVMVQAIASAIDKAALVGDGTNNSPVGLYHDADVAHTTLGTADGAALNKYAELLAAVFAVRGRNLAPNAAIYSEREAEHFAGLTDTTGQPLRAPAAVEALSHFSTTQVPTDLTEGTATDASFAAVGKFDQLAVGYRPQIGVRVEASPLNGEDLTRQFVAYCRADVAVMRPGAFQIVDGIVPAA